MEWMLMPYRRYAEFSGRSRRKEYWMFTLLNVIVSLCLYALIGGGAYAALTARARVGDAAAPLLTPMTFGPLFWVGVVLFLIWFLATIIPMLAVTVRRLHDRNMTGWYLLGFAIVTAVLSRLGAFGSLVVLVLEIGWIVVLALPGTPGPNEYGADPLGQADPEVFA